MIWHIYIGESWLGSLEPTGESDGWTAASFTPGESWGNFAPWFEQAYRAYDSGDDVGWEASYGQLLQMGLHLATEEGETLDSPTILIDGKDAWFSA